MVDDANEIWLLSGEPIGDGRRLIARPVVDDHDLEALGQPGQLEQGLTDQRPQVRLFVVRRKEIGELRNPASILGHRSRCGGDQRAALSSAGLTSPTNRSSVSSSNGAGRSKKMWWNPSST